MNIIDERDESSIPLRPLKKDELAGWLEKQPAPVRSWVENTGFEAEAGKSCLVPGDGRTDSRSTARDRRQRVGPGRRSRRRSRRTPYHVEGEITTEQANRAALGWALGTYSFDQLRETKEKEHPKLEWPSGCDQQHVQSTARATFLVRDLINTPASDMGPADLAESAKAVAEDHGATFRVIVGDDLLNTGFPAIHAVGRAAAEEREPRLIDFTWGDSSAPQSDPRRQRSLLRQRRPRFEAGRRT